jgi:hypothetical protein
MGGGGTGNTAPLVLSSATDKYVGRGRRDSSDVAHKNHSCLYPASNPVSSTAQPSIPAVFRSNSALSKLSSATQDMVACRSPSCPGFNTRTLDAQLTRQQIFLQIFCFPCILPNHQHSSHNMPVARHTTNGVSRIKSTPWAPELRHSVVWSRRHTVFSSYGSRY